MSTILKKILQILLVLVIIAGAGGLFYFRNYLPNTVAPRSFPQTEGDIEIDGLNGTVNIYRDTMGIAHIYASTSHDLFFAEGYVHAQERFWQMDFYRHVGEGRTAEIFGATSLPSDKFLATLGWKKTSLQEYEAMSKESKDILQAYADGVNAYLEGKSSEELALEYSIVGLPIINPEYKIEPWEPYNTLAWAKALSWDLRNNLDEEIEHAVLMKTLTREQMSELYPPYPDDHPVIVNHMGGEQVNENSNLQSIRIPDETLAAVQYNISMVDDLLGPLVDGVGSNSFAISGEHTVSGKPLLANDPHLGIAMPAIWYQLSMHCVQKTIDCPYDFAGYSLAGAPGIVLGHNDRIAWGFTFSMEDVMDLYIEKVNPDNPNQYEVNGEWVDFESHTETINVGGSDPVEIVVRSTRHGPVISDTYGDVMDVGDPKDKSFVPFRDRSGLDLPNDYVISLSWTALSLGNTLTKGNPIEAVLGFNRAQNWDEFRKAASIFHTPGHNLLYADVDGNIGYIASGDVPIRKNGNGSIPVPGWNSEYDWTAIIPFGEMPYTLNPPEGYIVTANNNMIGKEYPYFLTAEWDYGFRANRIVELIEAGPGKFDIPSLQAIQLDSFDASADVFVPLVLQMDERFATPNQAIAFNALKNWDFQVRGHSQAAAIYEAFWRALLKNTFQDELPETYWPSGGDRWFEVMRNLSPESDWWDDVTTDSIESRDEIIKKSFSEGVSELENILGKDPSTWTWGGIHVAVFRAGGLGETGIELIDSLFNRGPIPTGGGPSIVNATSWNAKDGYEVTNLPSMRTIYDLSDFSNSLSGHTTGQSGHPYHPHYFDIAPVWGKGEYYPMYWAQDEIAANMESHLTLTPK